MREHEDLIRDVPLLARLPAEDLRALASRGYVRRYGAGALIFREGAPGNSLHIVIEGSVRVALHSATGEEATVALLGPGEFLGDLALLDGRPRSASGIASQRTKTLVVTRRDFTEWLSGRPSAALALLEALSLRVRRTDEALTDLAFLDLPQRLAKRLLNLASAHPEIQAGGEASTRVRLRVTQSELASMLGVSRESVNKQLNSFAREGWIELGRGSVTLTDREALRTFA
jgi:CRP/FNR family transcriptional regulator/CRP/FNR family cyclic AMP-dependent transcriptional regulator